MLNQLKTFLLGKPRDPFSKDNQRHIALVAFLAWVGLGSDGLSSACYGPALGYQALGNFHHLALWLALLTAATVFLIALSYNQVIELFPNGGGGYKVANNLLGPFAGVVSGTALLIDYMLTIAISLVSCVDAIYSLLPNTLHGNKIFIEIVLTFILMLLNIRGMKESIKFLLPIFLGFFITHILIIFYGIIAHGSQLPKMLMDTANETSGAVNALGFIAVMAVLLRAYSLGSSTYTGLEAVSNNVNILAEPRVRTGQITMLYMAFSLSIIASGIILLYLLWDVEYVRGMTLNAAVFQQILGVSSFAHIALVTLLFFEAGLLLVGANTGYLGGPAVLANMAIDDWVPRRFSLLSSRLVKQNGVLFFGICAAAIILLTEGSLKFLVVLYSINVFITFSISLFGLTVYWWQNREKTAWLRRFILSLTGFIVCAFILLVTIFTKFDSGSLIAIILTTVVVSLCYALKKYYEHYEALKQQLDKDLEIMLEEEVEARKPQSIDKEAPTAVILVKRVGAALHTILWVERLFPKYFKNYLFVSYGQVDTGSFGSEAALKALQKRTDKTINYLTRFARQNGIAAKGIADYGADPIQSLIKISEDINLDFPHNVFFASKYIYMKENLFTRFIHDYFLENLQRNLQKTATKMLIVPLMLRQN